MDWQQWVSLAIVGATAAVWLRSQLRRRKFSFERNTVCGCCAAGRSLAPQYSVVLRARKGERPQMVFKMK